MTVVFAGSLGSDARMWERQLAAGIRGVVVEHPGHGGARVIDVAHVADLARNTLAHVGDDRFSVFGVSLGGAIAMQLALDVPERIDKLVLMCTSARFGDPEVWRERAATVRREGLTALVDTVLSRWFTPGFADVRRYRDMFLSTDPEGYARCCDAVARWDARDVVSRIAARTLVVSGADDPATPPDHGELLAERIPGARHVVVPNARHLANVERADEVNRLVEPHLA